MKNDFEIGKKEDTNVPIKVLQSGAGGESEEEQPTNDEEFNVPSKGSSSSSPSQIDFVNWQKYTIQVESLKRTRHGSLKRNR